MDKKQLAINLSKLKIPESFNINLEQYQSEGELVADILWKAFINKDIKNKTIADFGCGNGIFGIGALLFGARKVYFVDIDKKVIKLAKENYKNLNLKNGNFINLNVLNFKYKVDTVLMNPPFGVQNKHNDKLFLEKSFEVSDSIYSLHKIESKNFIEKISKNNNFKVIKVFPYEFLIKKIFKFHKSYKYYIKVGCWHLKNV